MGRIKELNARLRADEVKFWGNVLLASACSNDADSRGSKVPKRDQPSFGMMSSDAQCLFGILDEGFLSAATNATSPGRVAVGSGDGLDVACCAASCGRCMENQCTSRGVARSCCPKKVVSHAKSCS